MTVTHPISLTTRSGIELDVRPATEADEAQLAAFFDRVSDEDRRFRFFTAAEHVGHEQLKPLVQADHFHSESYLAFDKANGELVASGLLACDKALDTAEIAVSVCNTRKGEGIGWAMLDMLAGEAQKRGARRAISIESRENHAAIEVERDKGFTPEPFEDDPTLVILSRTFK
ncbi:GNAT family N-acetyltransferase [Novosphingobium album (ex Liu et al. 2023)]|uniref:GNAT family N-acetyltransferase n=1 Tax=Novosphingobium album (ex Liu et al. 2023) TaxID=3031130 RepID=A0ABT5WVK4_9SPHN|nr:GNAT family N-acetyltransferase [Novosphingobium album (ex Liu et al. 2023)]MDE8653914.1 GNAT family N-acetyltransferase [Novosphingobium album (ex Liu et al. 2023)]